MQFNSFYTSIDINLTFIQHVRQSYIHTRIVQFEKNTATWLYWSVLMSSPQSFLQQVTTYILILILLILASIFNFCFVFSFFVLYKFSSLWFFVGFDFLIKKKKKMYWKHSMKFANCHVQIFHLWAWKWKTINWNLMFRSFVV